MLGDRRGHSGASISDPHSSVKDINSLSNRNHFDGKMSTVLCRKRMDVCWSALLCEQIWFEAHTFLQRILTVSGLIADLHTYVRPEQ
ncbi:MAG: hypothetical protein JWQ87_4808 [Candidatus Sulfotelmatobacter sp.]|nr:hypothetical protein [Candidatus Sulfotelmatobacter sp.]